MIKSVVKGLVCLWVLFCPVKIALGQDHKIPDETRREIVKDKQAFMETFNKEQKQLARQTESGKRVLDTRPAHIPNSMLSFQNESNALGISNACLNKNKAFKMAKYRALATAALQRACTVKYVSDHYATEEKNKSGKLSRNTWEEYGKIKASFRWEPHTLKVIDSHYTVYDEGLVKVSLPPPMLSNKKANSLKVTLDVYHRRNQIGNQQQDQWKYELQLAINQANKPNFNSYYSLDQTPKEQDISCKWKGQKDSTCQAYFLYRPKNQFRDTANHNIQYSLDNGLWAAYFKSMANKLILTSQQEAKKLKNLQQSYDKDFENLSRSIASDNFKISLSRLSIINNNLTLKSKVYNLGETINQN